MKKIVVLGAGRVGRVVALDLGQDHEVTIVDRDPVRLESLPDARIRRQRADLSSPEAIRRTVAEADIVVGAVPGSIGFATLAAVIEAGRDVVDISFFPEDPFLLDEEARHQGVTAVVDCGVAPGLSNMILGRSAAEMAVESFICYVGGLPMRREGAFEYKAPFSPADVIEEYIRPARFVEGGRPVVKPALSDVEILDIPGVGRLEAFNSDGLRTLLKTMTVPNMVEKTLRYPGHAHLMRALREAGFFGREEIETPSGPVRPIDVTSALLFKEWRLDDEEDEFTVMRILLSGVCERKRRRVVVDLLDRRDPVSGHSSMARTTGFPAAAVTRLVLDGKVPRKGICPPERIGQDEAAYRYVMEELASRNVSLRSQIIEEE